MEYEDKWNPGFKIAMKHDIRTVSTWQSAEHAVEHLYWHKYKESCIKSAHPEVRAELGQKAWLITEKGEHKQVYDAI